jgi:hypothetical protein
LIAGYVLLALAGLPRTAEAGLAQDPAGPPAGQRVLANGLRVEHVALPGCPGHGFAVVWPQGLDADPAGGSGLAAAVAIYRQLAAAPALPAGAPVTASAAGDYAVVAAAVPAAEVLAGIAFVTSLLDPPAGPDQDAADLALGRAALAADDAEWLFPGPILRGMARAALCAGSPLAHGECGSAVQLQAQSAAVVIAAARALPAEAPIVVTIGGGDAAALAAAGARWGRLAVRDPGARSAPTPDRSPPLPAGEVPHARIDGPFAAIALAVPPTERDGTPALALAVEVLRGRAQRAFRGMRGNEVQAKAPFVSWSWLDGDPLVVLCRRGRDGAAAAAPRKELETLLAGALAPVEPRELTTAVAVLQAELAWPPFSAAQQQALCSGLGPLATRARLLATARRRGIDAECVAALAAVGAGPVQAALQAIARAERRWTGALVPQPRPGPWHTGQSSPPGENRAATPGQ